MLKLTDFVNPLCGDGAELSSLSPFQNVSIANTKAIIPLEPGTI